VWPCSLVDLSLNGALLEFPTDLVACPADRYQLDVSCFPSAPNGTVVSAEIVVVHARGQHVGVRFEEVDEESLSHIRKFILTLADDPTAAL
jgi:PilZ domain-containing protein